jgi:hypothetical protein
LHAVGKDQALTKSTTNGLTGFFIDPSGKSFPRIASLQMFANGGGFTISWNSVPLVTALWGFLTSQNLQHKLQDFRRVVIEPKAMRFG